MPEKEQNPNPQGQAASNPHSYDFILQKPVAVKRKFGNTKGQRIAIIVAIVTVILVIGLVLSVFLSGDGGKSAFQTKVAVQQAKLLQIANRGIKDGVSTDARGYASTVKLTIETDNKDLLALVSKANKKIIDKQSKAVDSQVNAKLNTAAQNNHFDAEMFDTLKDELSIYQQNVRAAYDGTDEAKLKNVYGVSFTHAGQLIRQQPAAATTQ